MYPLVTCATQQHLLDLTYGLKQQLGDKTTIT